MGPAPTRTSLNAAAHGSTAMPGLGCIRAGVIARRFWELWGLLVGTFIAFQLAFPGVEL